MMVLGNELIDALAFLRGIHDGAPDLGVGFGNGANWVVKDLERAEHQVDWSHESAMSKFGVHVVVDISRSKGCGGKVPRCIQRSWSCQEGHVPAVDVGLDQVGGIKIVAQRLPPGINGEGPIWKFDPGSIHVGSGDCGDIGDQPDGFLDDARTGPAR